MGVGVNLPSGLDELSAQLAASKKALKEKRAAEKKEAERSAGDAAFAPVSFAPVFSLTPVSRYLAHVQKEPREILEARFLTELGLPAPKEARHDWLAVRLAYHFQIKYYQAQTGGCPPNVARRAVEHHLSSRGGLYGKTFDADDPVDVEIWDDTYVAAASPNPYSKGAARSAFLAVEMGGAAGVAFEPLCKTLEAMLETSVGHAQDVALDMFTKKVQVGLTKIVIRG